MTVEVDVEKGSDWKIFIRKHWSIVAAFIVVGILALAGAVYVFLWIVGNAQSSGMVPTILGFWTMRNVVDFILNLIFWELLLIGLPVAISALAGWQWWKRLPSEEKKGYRFLGRRSRTTSGGGGVSILFFIAFCIKIYLDGNWNIAIASWTLDYVVGTMILILIWTVIIFGIPLAIGLIWWINHELKKKPQNPV